MPGLLQVWDRSLSVFYEDALPALLGVCRGLVGPVSARAVVLGHTSVLRGANGHSAVFYLETEVEGLDSRPSVWQPLTRGQLGLEMGLAARSQVLGGKGQSLAVSGWISAGFCVC